MRISSTIHSYAGIAKPTRSADAASRSVPEVVRDTPEDGSRPAIDVTPESVRIDTPVRRDHAEWVDTAPGAYGGEASQQDARNPQPSAPQPLDLPPMSVPDAAAGLSAPQRRALEAYVDTANLQRVDASVEFMGAIDLYV